MSAVLRWDRLSRTALAEVLPEALVILPLGATEQHGPHLATGTDTLSATVVAERSAAAAAPEAGRSLVLAPALPYGASDHHLPFGATLSLAQTTLRAALSDLLASAHAAGARRVLLLNGHGGNRAVCSLVAADAARDPGLTVVAASYWELAKARGVPADAPAGAAVPGHAGWFETSLVLAVDAALAGSPPSRPAGPPPTPVVAGADVATPDQWTRIDGYTDDPASADAAAGERLLDALVQAVAAAVVEIAAVG